MGHPTFPFPFAGIFLPYAPFLGVINNLRLPWPALGNSFILVKPSGLSKQLGDLVTLAHLTVSVSSSRYGPMRH